MTKNAKLATAATVALLSGIAIMYLFHAYGPFADSMMRSGVDGMSPMVAMGEGMGWMIVLGPLAMILSFGGFVTLIVLLVTLLVRSAAKPD